MIADNARFIPKVEAAQRAAVTRRTLDAWIRKGLVETNESGDVLRLPFEMVHAAHVLIARLQETLTALPPQQLPAILTECLGAEYLVALGNLVRNQSTPGDGKARRGHAK